MSARWIRDGDVWWIAVVGGRPEEYRVEMRQSDGFWRARTAVRLCFGWWPLCRSDHSARAALRDLADELELYDRAAAAYVRQLDAPENSR